MMKVLAIALLILAGPLALSGEEFPAGWDKVRWGMTEEEITKAYPEVQRASETGEYEFNGREYVCHLELPDVFMAGTKYTAHFLMDLKGKLACVQLERDFGSAEKSVPAYDKAREQLSKQYAPPTEEEDLAKPGIYRPGSKKAIWRSTHARVDLLCTITARGGFCRVSLAFQKPLDAQE